MTSVAAVVRTLALALWVGGMAALDFIDAPVRFASPLLTRNQAVGIGQAVFARWNPVEWTLALIALAAALLAASPIWTAWLLGFMLVLVTVQGWYLAPAITRLSQGLDFVNRASGDPRYAAIRHLHSTYAVFEVILLVAGAVILGAWAVAGRR